MPNYNLEEFKAWLEAEPARKVDLDDWDDYLADSSNFSEVLAHPNSETLFFDRHASQVRQWQREVLLSQVDQLKNENQTHLQALQTSQEWHERQKAEIIAQWKEKHQTLLSKWKTSLRQEISLIKEVLHE